MVQYLLDRGRRRIAFVGALMASDQRAAQRADGYREALSAAGLAPIVVDLPQRSSVSSGGPAFSDLLARHPDLDAVYFSNDVLALGALFECQRRGIAVPDQIAVAGFGDLDFAASCVPPLTTIRPPREGIGRETAAILLARFAGQTHLRRSVDLGFELQVRESA
jgi:LacI family gluconate utilization system Gnt-I transcriptional repressor